MGEVMKTGAFETLQETWGYYRKGFIPLMLITLIVLVPLGIFDGWFQLRYLGKVPANPFSHPAVIGYQLEFAMIQGVLSLYWLAAILPAIADLRAHKEPSVEQAYVLALKQFSPLLLVTAIVWLVGLAGLFLFVIPGILILLFALFVPQVVVLGHERGLTAIRKSFTLVRSGFWHITLTYVLAMIVTIAAGFLLTIPVAFIAGPAHGTSLFMIDQVVSTAISILTKPYLAIVTTVLYYQYLQ